jgi:hypothetical protein
VGMEEETPGPTLFELTCIQAELCEVPPDNRRVPETVPDW